MNENDNTVKKRKYTGKDGKFKKGNPGKPKGAKHYVTLLEEAVKRIEEKRGKNLFDHLVERAFLSDKVLVAVAKKFIPDQQATEIKSSEDTIQFIIKRAKPKDKGS